MRRNFWLGLLGVALVLSLAWGFNEYRQANNFRVATENQYSRSFRDLASHLDQLETDLSKSRVASTSNQKVLYLSQASGISDSAMKDMAQLPTEETGLGYVGEFINQVGDFTRTISHRVAVGGAVTPEEEKTLADIHERVIMVNNRVQDLVNQVDTENLAWTTKKGFLQRLGLSSPRTAVADSVSGDGPASSVSSGLSQLDASLQKLPPFSYTGEYAKRTVDEPLGLPKGEVNKDQALNTAKVFLSKVGNPGANPEFTGVSAGPLGGYIWKQGNAVIEVSKRGGVVTLYRDERELLERTLTPEDAKKKAMATLTALGWNLVLTSTEDLGAYLQLEAVGETNGIRYYPDKIRLTVALDNGQLIGYDSTAYYAYHHDRTFNKRLTLDQARSKLRSGFSVKENRLAVIPVTGNKEIMAYEFRGNYQGEDYLVYINSENGTEEKITRIIKTPRGEYMQ